MEANARPVPREGVEDGGAASSPDEYPRSASSLSKSDEAGSGDVGGGAGDGGAPSKLKKPHRRWTSDDDLLGVKAVVTVSAHVAPYGDRTRRFAAAADAFKNHPQASLKTDAKHLRDRFCFLTKNFSVKDKAEACKSEQEEI